MFKDEGNFYTYDDSIIKTRIKSIQVEQESSLFFIIATSKSKQSEITIIEICENEFIPKCLMTLKFDCIIIDAIIIKNKSSYLLFAIGYENISQMGKESIYFAQEINILLAESLSKPNFKTIKSNFKSLSHFNDSIYILSQFDVYKYNISEMTLEISFSVTEQISKNSLNSFNCSLNEQLIVLTTTSNLNILDKDMKQLASIAKPHTNDISCIDFNTNKSKQILSCANESFLKFWDLRNTRKPNFVLNDPNTLISQANFNQFYDQLVLYSTINGSMTIYSANSISSSVSLRMNDEKLIPHNQKLKYFESALDDYVNSVTWSSQNAWIFAAGAGNKCYFDVMTQDLKFETMF